MQLTRLDRWLRERFVHETLVYTMREPGIAPACSRYEELPEKPGRKYRHLYAFRNERNAEELIAQLKRDQQMFTTRVVDRQGILAKLMGPANNRSVTWWVIWKIIAIVGISFSVVGLKRLWDNPKVRQTLRESMKTLKE